MAESHSARAVALIVLGLIAACGSDGFVVADFDGDCRSLQGPGAAVGIDAGSGEVVWERTIGDATGVGLADGVVAGAGSSGAALGIDVVSGDLLWCEDFGRVDQEGNIVQPGFAGSGDVLATAVAGGDVIGIEPRSGAELWRTGVGVVEGLHVESGSGTFVVSDFDAADSHLVDLDPKTGAASDGETEPAADTSFVLEVEQPYVEGRQEAVVTVVRDSQKLWSGTLPGFVVTKHGDLVVIIDQTGGTGLYEGEVDTRVTAYEVQTGALRWQVPLPGTPQLTFHAASIIVVPVGTELYAIDALSGATVWQTDAGSPGRGGRFSTPGTLRFLDLDDSAPGTLVGVIVAEEPYRD